MHFIIYNLLLLLFLPLIAIFLIYRGIATKQSIQSIKEQLGFLKLDTKLKDPIWIHGVSVGETVAGSGVVNELIKLTNENDIVFSNTTKMGHLQSEKSIHFAKQITYYPYDFLFPVYCSIKKIRPALFASVDTEIWPNFRYILKKNNGKSAIINGIISDGTLRGAKVFAWLYAWTLSNIDLFCMQSDEDAKRVITLGADPSKVMVTGNCKADTARITFTDEELDKLFKLYFPKSKKEDTLIFIAGSTNPGEDMCMIDAYLNLKTKYPNLKMIIAPRQIDRGEEIASMLKSVNLTYNLRSNEQTNHIDNDVLILNIMGELAKAYFISDVSFVGGSLIKKGCHSILQPIAAGIGVCFGPHTFKSKDLVAQAKKYNIGFEITDHITMANKLDTILSDNDLKIKIKENCDAMLDYNKGASEKTAKAMINLLNGNVK